jgi:hypothetical protein
MRASSRYKMKRLHRLLGLRTGERGLLARAALLLVAMRLGLWLLPFQRYAKYNPRFVGLFLSQLLGLRNPDRAVGANSSGSLGV